MICVLDYELIYRLKFWLYLSGHCSCFYLNYYSKTVAQIMAYIPYISSRKTRFLWLIIIFFKNSAGTSSTFYLLASWWKKLSHPSVHVCSLSPMKFAGGPGYMSVWVCVRGSCSCCWALWGPKYSPDSFDWQHSQDTAGPQPSSTSFLFSLSLFSLSLTSFVSLCFTLCLHITLWVVLSFSGPPCQESVHFWGVGNFPHLTGGLLDK